ncbi:MAG: type IV pilus twitching motility protein PilT [Phycisphaerae bacterium]|jgi:twitching motility protein PilT
MTLEDWMRKARAAGASDLILVAGRPPCAYVHGRLGPIDDESLGAEDLNRLLTAALTDEQRDRLERTGDVDLGYGIPGLGRARMNVHRQRGTYAAAIRFVNTRIPTFDELGLPGKLAELAQLPRGLVLVTGATGSGKSTTLAAMIEYMNDHFERHVITLEDPIEFLFSHRRCIIEQREIGGDSPGFVEALRYVVRQKPDVILVGEMRDRETIATALTAAETGHLVLGTLHTSSAAQTIERIIDVFEAVHQPQIRVQLANSLKAVVCQVLVNRQDRPGMVPALEILVMTSAVRRAIRDGETHLIPGMIETGQKFGMVTLDRSLADLVAAGVIGAADALAKAADYDRLEKMLNAGTPVGNVLSTRSAVVEQPEPPVPVGTAPAKAKAWH